MYLSIDKTNSHSYVRLTTPTFRRQRRVIDYFFPSVSVVYANDLCHSMANQESLEYNTQVKCRHYARGWVFLNSQEDVSTLSQKKYQACLRKSNSHRAKRRAQDPKPIGRPPKQVLKKSNRDRKSDLRDRLGDSLHATAHINVANKDDDDDELAAQSPVSKPVTRPWEATPGTNSGTSSYAETQRRPPQNRGTVTWASYTSIYTTHPEGL